MSRRSRLEVRPGARLERGKPGGNTDGRFGIKEKSMVKAKRDVGRGILDGIRELKRGKIGGTTQFVRIRQSAAGSPRGRLFRMYNPPHPGEVLREFVLESATVEELAGRLGVSRIQLSRVLNGRSA